MTTPPTTQPPRRRRLPKFRPDPSAFAGFTLTDRDIEMIKAVAEFRFLTADHIRALMPNDSAQGITRRLQGLFQTEHLRRLRTRPRVRLLKPEELRPRIVYALATKGKEALLQAGTPEEEVPWSPDWNLRGADHLEHELMIANFRLTLQLALNDHPTGEMRGWASEEQLKDAVTVEKRKGTVTYRPSPDGYAAVRVAGTHRNLFFEADANTEEHGRIEYKARSYWHYLAPGSRSPYWAKFENPEQRLVLFVTKTEQRLSNMMDTLVGIREFGGKGLRQFWFTVEGDFSVREPASLLAPIWRTVGLVKVDDAGDVTDYSVERKALFEDR